MRGYMSDRIKHLEAVSGLRVTVKPDTVKQLNMFEFYSGYLCVHTTYNYQRAKAFAKGVSVGRGC